jgi:hypothetical protein
LQGLSLAQQIAQLDDAAPVGAFDQYCAVRSFISTSDFDIEDIQPAYSENEPVVDPSAAREHYLDVG